MTLKTYTGLDPFDIVWKNFFDDHGTFSTLKEKIGYPVDIYETENGLRFELAVVGLDKEDLHILTESDTLRVTHNRVEKENERFYIQKGIARRSFDLAWKIAPKFDLSKLEASMDKGLLTLDIPYAIEKAPKQIKIK